MDIKKTKPADNEPKNPKRDRATIEEGSPVLGGTERARQEVHGTKGAIFLLQEQTVLLEQIKDLLEEIRDNQ